MKKFFLFIIPVFLFVFTFSTARAAGTLDQGLVGYWTMDGKDTTWSSATAGTVADVSGNGNTGTLTLMNRATTPTVGKFGQALTFTGGTDETDIKRVALGDVASIRTPAEITVSVWAKSNNLTSTASLVSKFEHSTGRKGFAIRQVGADIEGRIGDGTSRSLITITNGASLNWNMWTLTYSGTTINFYKNGTFAGTAEYADFDSTGTYLFIGAAYRTNTTTRDGFNGVIDDVRIYTRALSAAEITQLYNLGQAKINASQNVTQSSLDKGLVGLWSMDGKDTTWTSATAGTVADKSGLGNTGTLTNMNRATSPTAGKLGQAMYFNYSTQYILLSNAATYDLTSDTAPVTVSAWVKTGNSIINSVTGIMKKGGQFTGTADDQYNLHSSNKTLNFGLGNDTTTALASTGDVLVPNTWYFVTGVADATKVYIYVNGALVNSTARLSGLPPAPNWSAIGARNSNQMYWYGNIDDVRIYNRALSAAEIKQLYNLGQAKINASQNVTQSSLDKGLVGLWSMDGKDTIWSSATAGTVADKSGNGRTGTLSGMSRAASPVAGKIGQGLNFSSALSNEITTPTFSDGTSGIITVSVWQKRSTVDNLEHVLFFENPGALGGFYVGWQNQNAVGWVSTSGGVSSTVTGTFAADTKWHHFVFVADGTNLKVYVDGGQITSSPATKNVGTSVHRIGSSASRFFNGVIDEVRLYDRALSDSEITQLYKLGQATVR